jgi:hypothetical protein
MAANYVLLEKITVGAAGASSVTFSSIPQTGYTDLIIKTSTRNTNAVNLINYRLSFNGNNSVTINERLLYGDGSNPGWAMPTATGGTTYGFATGASATANVFANNDYYIANYTSSNHKSVSIDMAHENDGTTAYVGIDATLWTSSDAITSITLTPTTPSIGQYSTFYLYGVAKLGTTPVIVPYATGGDTIMTDGTYWYHAFKANGTFTPAKGLSCDYLVVAGGGGGSGKWYYEQGGGGAGGLRSTVTATGGGGSLESPLSLASGTGYTVTIGAGGAGALGPVGGTVAQHTGTVGTNSSFSSITSTGGGGGAGSDGTPSSGGSGGGGGGTGAAGTANQGYAGGNSGGGGGWSAGGGGGGAGAVGGNGSNPNPGSGGVGIQITALATPTSTGANSGYYAGGGGGASYDSLSVGAGGSGGGGAGSSTSTGVAGTANTGGGGGAGSKYFSTFYDGGSGGSGIVIVRYAV